MSRSKQRLRQIEAIELVIDEQRHIRTHGSPTKAKTPLDRAVVKAAEALAEVEALLIQPIKDDE